jgi:hypothetical protein
MFYEDPARRRKLEEVRGWYLEDVFVWSSLTDRHTSQVSHNKFSTEAPRRRFYKEGF